MHYVILFPHQGAVHNTATSRNHKTLLKDCCCVVIPLSLSSVVLHIKSAQRMQLFFLFLFCNNSRDHDENCSPAGRALRGAEAVVCQVLVAEVATHAGLWFPPRMICS